MGPLLLALALLAPRGAPIEAAAVARPTHAVSTREDVLRLCRSLEFPERRREARLDRAAAEAEQVERRARALQARYAVEVGGRGLTYDYDEARRSLTLTERAQLVAADGALVLWAVEEPEMALPAEPALARRIVAAARNGEGRLRLHFVLPEDEEAAICSHASGTRSYGLGVEPVAWAFLVGEQVLARGGGDDPAASVAAPARGPGRPAVEVGAPVSGDAPALLQALRTREAAMLACYRRGLAERPDLDGSLVLELEAAPGGGKRRSVRVSLDALHEEQVARCVLAALDSLELPAGKGGKAQVPVHFRLDGR